MIFLILCLLTVSLAQIPIKPTFDDNFAATVDYTETTGRRTFTIKGAWYSDYTDRADAYDATLAQVGEVLVFENQTDDGSVTFIYRKETNDCSKNNAPVYLPHPFSFLANALQNGTCVANDGTVGAAWAQYDVRAMNITLCASNDGTKPFWLEEFRFGVAHSQRTIQFDTFVSGKPSSRYFVLPDACKGGK